MSRMIDDEEELKDYGLIEKCSNLVTDENKCLDTWDDENADYKECKRINCYKKQLKRLEAENDTLHITIEKLKADLSQAETSLYALKAENEKLKKEIEKLKEKYDDDRNLLMEEIQRLMDEIVLSKGEKRENCKDCALNLQCDGTKCFDRIKEFISQED